MLSNISKILCINSNKNSKYFFVSHEDKTVFIYSLESCEILKSFELDIKACNFEVFGELTEIFYTDFIRLKKIDIDNPIPKTFTPNLLYSEFFYLSSDKTFIAYPSQNSCFSIWSVKKK